MRAIFLGVLLAIMSGFNTPASASLPPEEFAKIEVAGFRIGMSMSDAEAIIRARNDVEEPLAELMKAYDCNQLVPGDSGLAYSAMAIARLPATYYVDTRDHHLLDVSFRHGPAGAEVQGVTYWNFLPGRDWSDYLSYAEARFGPPDIVRSENDEIDAIWCEDGDPKCAHDYYYRHRIILSWKHRKDAQGEQHRYGLLSLYQSLWLGDDWEKAAAVNARKDPAAGKEMFERCRYAVRTFTERAAFEGHLGDMVGTLASWSPPISEPRLVDRTMFRAIGLDSRTVTQSHDCAMRYQAGLRDRRCNERSMFRWLRVKGDFYLFAMRDVSEEGYLTQSGTISRERRVYCLVRYDHFGSHDLVWSGESLVDLSRWLAAGEQRSKRPGRHCSFPW